MLVAVGAFDPMKAGTEDDTEAAGDADAGASGAPDKAGWHHSLRVTIKMGNIGCDAKMCDAATRGKR